MRKELKTLAEFIGLYCGKKHAQALRTPVINSSPCDVREIAGEDLELCPDCRKLLAHAFLKRSRCRMDPKPSCKHCPIHCYHPAYRAKIQEVMRFSGPRLLLGGRISYLLHLLF
jgi:hypothetical protein